MIRKFENPSTGALIVVVECDPHIRKLERYFLEEAGYSVEFADNGHHGLAQVRAARPAIVISEILLPLLDGLALCRAIKGDPEVGQTRVLLFSILSAADRAREAGADGFLRKPLNDALLIRTVEELLGKSADH